MENPMTMPDSNRYTHPAPGRQRTCDQKDRRSGAGLIACRSPIEAPPESSTGSLTLELRNERPPSRRRGSQIGCGVAKEDKVEFEGEVIEALPNAMFRVKLDNDHVVLGHVAGKMRRFRIRILPGDRVRCELSPYDLDRARIVYRHR